MTHPPEVASAALIHPNVTPRRAAAWSVAICALAVAGCAASDGGAGPSAEGGSPTAEGGSPTGGPATGQVSAASDAPTAATADPAGTAAPATDRPATDPPATDQPATDQPVTNPLVTNPPAVDPPGTQPPPARDLSFLWIDPEEMVAAWAAANGALSAAGGGPRLELTSGDLAIAPLASAGDGFAAVDVFPDGFLSGTIDPGGEVSALVITTDPTGETAASVLASSLDAVVATWAGFGVDGQEFSVAVDAAYADLVSGGPTVGEQRFVRGPDGLTYVAVLSVIDDVVDGAPALEVAVIPVPDEEVARSIVELLRVEMRAVTG